MAPRNDSDDGAVTKKMHAGSPFDRDARVREQAHLAAQCDKLYADLLDRCSIILAEVGNRLVIGNEPARQPRHLDIAPSLTLKPPPRRNPIEVASMDDMKAGQLPRERLRRTTAPIGGVRQQRHRSPNCV